VKSVLVVNPFGIGDTLFSFYAIEALRAAYPEARVGLLCNERMENMARLNPSVSFIHEFNRDALRSVRSSHFMSYLGAYRSFIAQMRERRYEAMLDFSLGREFGFLGLCAGIPIRAGFDYRKRGLFLNRKELFLGYERNCLGISRQRTPRQLPAFSRRPRKAPLRGWRSRPAAEGAGGTTRSTSNGTRTGSGWSSRTG
jgi:hypothetical protein